MNMFIQERNDSMNQKHFPKVPNTKYEPGQLLVHAPKEADNHAPVFTIYAYLKSTEESHYCLRLVSLDTSSIAHSVFWRHDYDFPAHHFRLTNGCLSKKVTSPPPFRGIHVPPPSMTEKQNKKASDILSRAIKGEKLPYTGLISYVKRIDRYVPFKGLDPFIAQVHDGLCKYFDSQDKRLTDEKKDLLFLRLHDFYHQQAVYIQRRVILDKANTLPLISL